MYTQSLSKEIHLNCCFFNAIKQKKRKEKRRKRREVEKKTIHGCHVFLDSYVGINQQTLPVDCYMYIYIYIYIYMDVCTWRVFITFLFFYRRILKRYCHSWPSGKNIRGSIVVSIPACHAGNRVRFPAAE